MRLRCIRHAPIAVDHNAVLFWHDGDETEVAEVTSYLRGQIEQGNVEVLPETTVEPVVEQAPAPARVEKKKRGKK